MGDYKPRYRTLEKIPGVFLEARPTAALHEKSLANNPLQQRVFIEIGRGDTDRVGLVRDRAPIAKPATTRAATVRRLRTLNPPDAATKRHARVAPETGRRALPLSTTNT